MIGLWIKKDKNAKTKSCNCYISCKYDGTNIEEIFSITNNLAYINADYEQPLLVILTQDGAYALLPDRYVVIVPQDKEPVLYGIEEFEANFEFVKEWSVEK